LISPQCIDESIHQYIASDAFFHQELKVDKAGVD